MVFEIGEPVSPVVDITYSGELVPTAGTSGTVLDRQFVSIDSDNNQLYSYQVRLDPSIPVGSGNNTQQASIFWFSESDLGNEQASSPLVDLESVLTSIAQGQTDLSAALNTITDIQGQIDEASPYYDLVSNFLEVTSSHSSTLNSKTFNPGDQAEVNQKAREAGKDGEYLGFDGVVLSELAENALGYFQVLQEIDEEIKTNQQQSETQNNLAREDDAENFNAYYSTFITSTDAQNLLAPTSEEANTSLNLNDTEITENNPDDQLKTLDSLEDFSDKIKLALGDE